jgi:hypothetical protein
MERCFMKRYSFVRSVLALALSAGLLAGCWHSSRDKEAVADESVKMAAADPAATEAIDAARASIAAAKANDWIWRDTEKTLKQAEEAAAAGDSKKAIALANTAKNEADLAVEQYKIEMAKFK